MLKFVVTAATALVIAGSSVAFAQQSGATERARWQPSQEDIAAFAAARIAGLKAGLVMTAEQERHWPAFEAALKDLARYRMERRAARQDDRPAQAQDPTERLRRRADALTGYGTVLKKLADAQEPLYNSLDDAQKRRFAVLARPTRQGAHWRQGHSWRERHGHREGRRHGEHGRWHGGHHRGDDGRRGRGTASEGERL